MDLLGCSSRRNLELVCTTSDPEDIVRTGRAIYTPVREVRWFTTAREEGKKDKDAQSDLEDRMDHLIEDYTLEKGGVTHQETTQDQVGKDETITELPVFSDKKCTFRIT